MSQIIINTERGGLVKRKDIFRGFLVVLEVEDKFTIILISPYCNAGMAAI